MITKITNHNDRLYDELFADISAHVPAANSTEEEVSYISVTTLEEYFQNIQLIGEYARTNPEKAYFMRLPIDENLFEIDANSRVINVPELYRRNGIAIAGDTFAETLWFKIDRYYDLQDLGETQIRIYWELPNSGKTAGWSTPVFKDINSEARHLIFGWLIPDILTEYAGDIKFYISFYRELNNTKVYTFNTLTQTVKINATLNLKDKLLTEDDTSEVTIVNRLRNTTNMGGIYVGRPMFSNITTAYDAPNEMLLTDDEEGQTLLVSAYSENNNATISYVLYRNGIVYNNSPAERFEKTPDKDIVNLQKTYYVQEGNKFTSVSTPTAENLSNYYEKCYAFTIDSAGSYQCKAIATIIVNGNAVNSGPSYTLLWVWEAPTEFEVDQDNFKFKENKYGIISGAESDGANDITVKWPTKNSNNSTQQEAAGYEATFAFTNLSDGITAPSLNSITKGGSDEKTQTITLEGEKYPFKNDNGENILGYGYIEATFTKTLNKENLHNITAISLPIQSPAKAYNANALEITPTNLIQVNSGRVKVKLTEDLEVGQSYSYVWLHSTSGNEDSYTQTGAIHTLPDNKEIESSFTKTGYYKVKIFSTYRKDTKETISSTPITVYSVN